MAPIYKTFKAARIVFFSLFLTVFIPLAVHAANPLYTVENVVVDVTSASAAKAREEAFTKAEQDAFAELAGRMVDDAQAANFAAVDPMIISPMIQDFEVTQEKLSSVRYVGTYTFNFDENAVRGFFANKGTSYSDVASPPTLVLPFIQKGNTTSLWTEDNDWMQAWGRVTDLKGAAPIAVPIGDVMDVSDISDAQSSDFDAGKLQDMLKRYDATQAIIAMAVPDDALAHAAPDAPVKGQVSVQMFRTDSGSAQLVKTITVTGDGTQNPAALYDVAVKQTRAALRGISKQPDAAAPMPSAPMLTASTIDVRVYFTGLEQWARAQRQIVATYGVKDVMVKSLSPGQARIQLGYQGDFENLRLALAQNRMVLSAPSSIHSYATPYEAASAAPVYDLRLNGPAMPAGVPVNDN